MIMKTDGRERSGSDGKRTNVASCYKGQVAGESNDRSYREDFCFSYQFLKD